MINGSLLGEVGCGLVLGRKQVGSRSFKGATGHGSTWVGPIQVGLPISRVQLDTGGRWVEMGLFPTDHSRNRLGLGRMWVHPWVVPVFDTSSAKGNQNESKT